MLQFIHPYFFQKPFFRTSAKENRRFIDFFFKMFLFIQNPWNSSSCGIYTFLEPLEIADCRSILLTISENVIRF